MDGLTDRHVQCHFMAGNKKTFTMNPHLKYYGPIVASSQDIDVFKFLKENTFWSLSVQSMVSNKVVDQEMF